MVEEQSSLAGVEILLILPILLFVLIPLAAVEVLLLPPFQDNPTDPGG